MRRVALLILTVAALLGSARADEQEDANKVSNDRPDRPLQMPPASSETKEAFDDFERFARRGAWERATKALYAIPDDQASRFVDGENGFIVSVAQKRRAVLAALSPEGQAAYRLFYDSEAKKLLDQAEGPSEQATLEKLFSSYFLTSVGDNAADRLGDLYFEQGQFDRAANCWLAILRDCPDTDLSPAQVTVKAAFALARAGRRSELAALREEQGDRYADELVTIAGRKAKTSEHLGQIASKLAAGVEGSSSASGGSPPALPESVGAAWQLRFAESVTAGMTPAEVTQWEASSLSGAVPAITVVGKTLFANYLSHVLAIDLVSGKMLWRSASFHNLDLVARQGQGQMIDPSQYAIVADGTSVWCLGRDVKDPNYQATSQLVCRRAQNGEVVWQSKDLPSYAGLELVGTPLLVRDTMFVAAKTANANRYYYGGGDDSRREYVLAIQPHDGKVLWKTEVGMIREGQRYYYYGMMESSPQPRFFYRAGSVYLDTQDGILARLDADSGTVHWGYGYPTDPVQGQPRFFFFNGMVTSDSRSNTASSPPLLSADAILIKGAKSDRICAIDPDRMKLLWDRPIAKSTRLLGADDKFVYLGGPELGALDLSSRSLRWSTALPGGSSQAQMLVRSDGLWQLTPRGIFELDPQSGLVRRIFRGEDSGADGGDLALTDQWVLAISNRTISAYPRGPVETQKAAVEGVAAPAQGGSDE